MVFESAFSRRELLKRLGFAGVAAIAMPDLSRVLLFQRDVLAQSRVSNAASFLSARQQPFFYEILHPGFLTGAQEQAAIAELERRRVPLILLANLDTSEFRDRTFGRDYNQALMRWIEANYQKVARFDTAASHSTKLVQHHETHALKH